MSAMLREFPTDWRTAVVLMAHPDDPEYGMSAAVAKWTAAGRTVRYVFACRGEAGIEGMAPEEAGPAREAEQRRAAGIVGVTDVDFWDFPDSEIRNSDALRAKITDVLVAVRPDVVVSIFGGPEWGPDMPNQRDHIEFAHAVAQAFDELADKPRWFFSNGPGGTYLETVDGYTDAAVEALAAHEKYLSVLDPDTPVRVQAIQQVDATTPARDDFGGRRVVEFILEREI